MDFQIGTYLIYSLAAIGLTTALARTLHRNGALFLEGIFEGRPGIAEAVNNLLVIGFYMLNMGYALLIFKTEAVNSTLSATENLVSKLGLLLVSLGIIHFANMLVFWKIKSRTDRNGYYPAPPAVSVQPPPPAPDAVPVTDFAWQDQAAQV